VDLDPCVRVTVGGTGCFLAVTSKEREQKDACAQLKVPGERLHASLDWLQVMVFHALHATLSGWLCFGTRACDHAPGAFFES
jgi:hypothetical protein